jgi:hypothetical protein
VAFKPESVLDVPLGAIVRSTETLMDDGPDHTKIVVAIDGDFGKVVGKANTGLLTVKWFRVGRVMDVDCSELEVMTEHLLDSPEEYKAAQNTKARGAR